MATTLDGLKPTVLDRRQLHADAEDERVLIETLQARHDEGKECRSKWAPAKERQLFLDVYRGFVRPKFGKYAHYKANFIKAFINRQCAQLTDNRPIPRIDAFKAGLREVAAVMKRCVESIWDEADMQRQTFKMAHTSAIEGSAGLACLWDPTIQRVVLEILRLDQVVIDPAVTEAAKINTDAEYFFIDRVLPLSLVQAAFPGRGPSIRADAAASNLSPITDEPSRGRSIWTPVKRALGGSAGSMALERVRVRECWVKDRQTKGTERLYPSYRRILVASPDQDAMVLRDEPNTYWDGEIPINWFDWEVDPNHPYGCSEVDALMESQLAFNQIGSDTVNAKLLSNIFSVIYDTAALSPETLKRLQEMDGSLLIEKIGGPNKTLTAQPPPPTNADSLQLMRFIFTVAQLLAGVPDVMLGENPGSLQSGVAIEGLQEGANTMTRARASRMEDFFSRIGQQLVSRTFQYWTTDRVLALVGVTAQTQAYAKYRLGFFVREDGTEVTLAERHRAFQDFKFSVLPGSSAPGSRMRRMESVFKLRMAGMATSEDVLEAGDFPNPSEMAKRGKDEMIANAPMMEAMKKMGGDKK